MPYDNVVTIDTVIEIDALSSKLRNYQTKLKVLRENFSEIETIIDTPERKGEKVVLDEEGHAVLENGKPKMELDMIPAITRIPENSRTYKPFSDVERTKQQSDSLAQFTTLKEEIDKLSEM